MISGFLSDFRDIAKLLICSAIDILEAVIEDPPDPKKNEDGPGRALDDIVEDVPPEEQHMDASAWEIL